jgi:hypothetical protein
MPKSFAASVLRSCATRSALGLSAFVTGFAHAACAFVLTRTLGLGGSTSRMIRQISP